MVAGMDEAQIKEMLDAWIAANLAVSKGQSYTIDGMTLTRVDADKILAQIDYWQKQYNAIVKGSASNPKVAAWPQ